MHCGGKRQYPRTHQLIWCSGLTDPGNIYIFEMKKWLFAVVKETAGAYSGCSD